MSFGGIFGQTQRRGETKAPPKFSQLEDVARPAACVARAWLLKAPRPETTRRREKEEGGRRREKEGGGKGGGRREGSRRREGGGLGGRSEEEGAGEPERVSRWTWNVELEAYGVEHDALPQAEGCKQAVRIARRAGPRGPRQSPQAPGRTAPQARHAARASLPAWCSTTLFPSRQNVAPGWAPCRSLGRTEPLGGPWPPPRRPTPAPFPSLPEPPPRAATRRTGPRPRPPWRATRASRRAGPATPGATRATRGASTARPSRPASPSRRDRRMRSRAARVAVRTREADDAQAWLASQARASPLLLSWREGFDMSLYGSHAT